MKRMVISTFIILICLFLYSTGCAEIASGTDILSGICDYEWAISDDGQLTINGAGRVLWTPWANYKDHVSSLFLSEGITEIGYNVFSNHSHMKSVSLPTTVSVIDSGAFGGDYALQDVYISDIYSWINISFSNEDSNPMTYAKKLWLNNSPIDCWGQYGPVKVFL